MATGDVQLDSNGNELLDASGNVRLDDGSGPCCFRQLRACPGPGVLSGIWGLASITGTVKRSSDGLCYYADASDPTSACPGTLLGDYTAVSGCDAEECGTPITNDDPDPPACVNCLSGTPSPPPGKEWCITSITITLSGITAADSTCKACNIESSGGPGYTRGSINVNGTYSIDPFASEGVASITPIPVSVDLWNVSGEDGDPTGCDIPGSYSLYSFHDGLFQLSLSGCNVIDASWGGENMYNTGDPDQDATNRAIFSAYNLTWTYHSAGDVLIATTTASNLITPFYGLCILGGYGGSASITIKLRAYPV